MNFGHLTIIFSDGRETPYNVLDLSHVGASTYLICQRPITDSRDKEKAREESFLLKNITPLDLTKAFRANNGFLIVQHHQESPLDTILDNQGETGDITIMPEHNNIPWSQGNTL